MLGTALRQPSAIIMTQRKKIRDENTGNNVIFDGSLNRSSKCLVSSYRLSRHWCRHFYWSAAFIISQAPSHTEFLFARTSKLTIQPSPSKSICTVTLDISPNQHLRDHELAGMEGLHLLHVMGKLFCRNFSPFLTLQNPLPLLLSGKSPKPW